MPTIEIMSPWSNTMATNNLSSLPPNPFYLEGTEDDIVKDVEYRITCKYRTSASGSTPPGAWSTDQPATRNGDATWTCDLSRLVNPNITYDFQANLDQRVDGGMWVHQDDDTVYNVTIMNTPPLQPPPPAPAPARLDKKESHHPVPPVVGKFDPTKGDNVFLIVYRVKRKSGDKKCDTVFHPIAVYDAIRVSDGTWEIAPKSMVPPRPGMSDKKRMYVMEIVLTKNSQVQANTTWVIRAS